MIVLWPYRAAAANDGNHVVTISKEALENMAADKPCRAGEKDAHLASIVVRAPAVAGRAES
jgi:hypothetical protein